MIKSEKISMYANETITFVILFSFYVYDLVLRDEMWDFYLAIREVTDIIYSSILPLDSDKLLDECIRNHHILRQKLFKKPKKPKEHLALHYPEINRQSGPIKNLSTIRCEAKHKIIIKHATITTSRKNTIYTVCLKEQIKFAYRINSKIGFPKRLETGPCTLFQIEDIENPEIIPDLFRKNTVYVSHLTSNGKIYKSGTTFIAKFDDYNIPIFGIVDYILHNDIDSCIIYQVLFTHEFNEEIHAYKVGITDHFESCTLSSLKYHPKCIIHKMFDLNYYITSKSAL